jgi:hypothetical protein
MNPPCTIPKRFAPWTPWRSPPGLESHGTLTRIWAARGTRPRIRRDRRFTWAKPAKGSGRRSLLEWPAEGSAPSELVEDCPARGTGLVMLPVSSEAMNQHLADISHCVSAIALRIRAGAGRPGSPRLIVPDNICAGNFLREPSASVISASSAACPKDGTVERS